MESITLIVSKEYAETSTIHIIFETTRDCKDKMEMYSLPHPIL